MEHLLTREYLWKHALTGVSAFTAESSCIQILSGGHPPCELELSAALAAVLGSGSQRSPDMNLLSLLHDGVNLDVPEFSASAGARRV